MINQGTILGRVGKIDSRTVSTGTKITNISMVTSKRYTKNGEKLEKVTWHNVTFFAKLADVAEKYVAVGDLLYVQGEMESQKYTDKEGQERTKFFIIGNNLVLMPKSREHASAPKESTSFNSQIESDDIPW